MKHVRCNLCGADDDMVVFARGVAQVHQIVRCRRCGLMYANPQEHIDAEYYANRRPNEVYDPAADENRQYYQKQVTQLPDNLRVLGVLNAALPNKGKLLEIGSFVGLFLDRIKADGWKPVGLEPYRTAANYARSKFGLEVIDGILPQPALPDGMFDAVVMLHVIEHIPDPAANVAEVRRLLRPGGMLAVETPRFDSLLFKILGHRERSMQNCPGHIYFFTETTLRRLLERNGFRVVRVDRVGRTLTMDRFLYNVGLVTRSKTFQQWLGTTAKVLGFGRIRFHVNFGDMQRMYAEAV
jgi:2-polyprenyl-3-methyl-5-hydroxy-6-metoxy-1,4-benzoquinol methylase